MHKAAGLPAPPRPDGPPLGSDQAIGGAEFFNLEFGDVDPSGIPIPEDEALVPDRVIHSDADPYYYDAEDGARAFSSSASAHTSGSTACPFCSYVMGSR